jgi:hypothetical protein
LLITKYPICGEREIENELFLCKKPLTLPPRSFEPFWVCAQVDKEKKSKKDKDSKVDFSIMKLVKQIEG